MAKNVAETAFHNFSTRVTTFRLRISQPSSSSHLALPFSVPIFPCALYEDDWGRVSGHPVMADSRSYLRFSDHVTKRNGGSGDDNEEGRRHSRPHRAFRFS